MGLVPLATLPVSHQATSCCTEPRAAVSPQLHARQPPLPPTRCGSQAVTGHGSSTGWGTGGEEYRGAHQGGQGQEQSREVQGWLPGPGPGSSLCDDAGDGSHTALLAADVSNGSGLFPQHKQAQGYRAGAARHVLPVCGSSRGTDEGGEGQEGRRGCVSSRGTATGQFLSWAKGCRGACSEEMAGAQQGWRGSRGAGRRQGPSDGMEDGLSPACQPSESQDVQGEVRVEVSFGSAAAIALTQHPDGCASMHARREPWHLEQQHRQCQQQQEERQGSWQKVADVQLQQQWQQHHSQQQPPPSEHQGQHPAHPPEQWPYSHPHPYFSQQLLQPPQLLQLPQSSQLPGGTLAHWLPVNSRAAGHVGQHPPDPLMPGTMPRAFPAMGASHWESAMPPDHFIPAAVSVLGAAGPLGMLPTLPPYCPPAWAQLEQWWHPAPAPAPAPAAVSSQPPHPSPPIRLPHAAPGPAEEASMGIGGGMPAPGPSTCPAYPGHAWQLGSGALSLGPLCPAAPDPGQAAASGFSFPTTAQPLITPQGLGCHLDPAAAVGYPTPQAMLAGVPHIPYSHTLPSHVFTLPPAEAPPAAASASAMLHSPMDATSSPLMQPGPLPPGCLAPLLPPSAPPLLPCQLLQLAHPYPFLGALLHSHLLATQQQCLLLVFSALAAAAQQLPGAPPLLPTPGSSGAAISGYDESAPDRQRPAGPAGLAGAEGGAGHAEGGEERPGGKVVAQSSGCQGGQGAPGCRPCPASGGAGPPDLSVVLTPDPGLATMVGGELSKRQPEQLSGAGGAKVAGRGTAAPLAVSSGPQQGDWERLGRAGAKAPLGGQACPVKPQVCDPGAVAALTQLPHQSRHKRRRQRHHPPVPSSLPVTQPHPSASSTNRPNHPCMGAPSCENEQQQPEQAHRGRGQLPHPGRIPGPDDQLGALQLPQCSAGVVCSNTGPEGCCSTSCAEGEVGPACSQHQMQQPLPLPPPQTSTRSPQHQQAPLQERLGQEWQQQQQHLQSCLPASQREDSQLLQPVGSQASRRGHSPDLAQAWPLPQVAPGSSNPVQTAVQAPLLLPPPQLNSLTPTAPAAPAAATTAPAAAPAAAAAATSASVQSSPAAAAATLEAEAVGSPSHLADGLQGNAPGKKEGMEAQGGKRPPSLDLQAGSPWPRQQLGQPGHQAHRQQRKRQRKAPATTARQPSDSSGSSGSVGNAAGDSDCGSNSPDM
ncbi:hypothetical protein V8C86DRAFT_295784 [Haematococcus lacustris]